MPLRERVLGTTGRENKTSVAMTRPRGHSFLRGILWAPLLAIGSAAFCVEIPFFFLGTPSGHDVEFHLYSWLEVLGQWKHGIFFPRWASLAHFAYGEPRFLFYPPASWTLGGLISLIFPWAIASPVFIWIALVLAGVSMFFTARRWLDRWDAMFAAVLYAVNPYHLVIVYWRSSFAELLASSLVPLLFLFVVQGAEERGWRVTAPLGFVLAAAWLTNAPAAVMIHYSLALLVMVLAWQKRSARIVFVSGSAAVLGACIAAFYLLPAIYEQRWIEIGNAVSAGSRPADNFLFIHTSDADHDAFNRLITWVAVLEIVIVFVGAVAAKTWRATQRAVWNSLVTWAAACSVMMFSLTALLWQVLPKMRFMQFPWRWLLCLSAVFTLLVTIGLKRWWMRVALYASCVVVIVVAWHRVQAPWWDNTGDLREMQDNIYTGAGYEGTDEYMPRGGEAGALDPSTLDKGARKVTVDGPAHAAIRVLQWSAESKVFSAEMSAANRLALRLLQYPAWRVEVNGRVVETSAREGTGQMLVPVVAGANRVEISFVRTWDRAVGGWISIVSLLGVILWLVAPRKYAV